MAINAIFPFIIFNKDEKAYLWLCVAIALLGRTFFFFHPTHMVLEPKFLLLHQILSAYIPFFLLLFTIWYFSIQIERHREELERQRDWLEVTLSSIGDAVIATDMKSKVTFSNSVAEKLTGWKAEEVLGRNIADVFRTVDGNTKKALIPVVQTVLESDSIADLQDNALLIKKDGGEIPVDDSCAPIKVKHGSTRGAILVFRDVSERKEASKKLQETQLQLMQSEKMADIGQLAAGVAHEINNPMGFIIGNLKTLKHYLANLFKIFSDYTQALSGETGENKAGEKRALQLLESIKDKENFGHIECDIHNLMEETLDGADRVKQIVTNLKDFAYPVQEESSETDLNKEIEKALVLVGNELKYHCKVHKHLQEIPQIRCNRGQIGQVLVNLLVNASQATKGIKGEITIRTYKKDSSVYLTISDNGEGIAEKNLKKIFNPFFTTKDVGKGTGLGLSLVYGIVKKHNWEIAVESEPGKGASFIIIIPVRKYSE